MTVEHTSIWLHSFSLTASFIPGKAGRKGLERAFRGLHHQKPGGIKDALFYVV